MANNHGNGGGNITKFTINNLRTYGFDYVTYSTSLTPHAGEGNVNLRITATVDAPASLVDTVRPGAMA